MLNSLTLYMIATTSNYVNIVGIDEEMLFSISFALCASVVLVSSTDDSNSFGNVTTTDVVDHEQSCSCVSTTLSCNEIKRYWSKSPSGYYDIVNEAGVIQSIYCNMEEDPGLCGSGGGWTRLAYLDMTDSTQSCPSGFRLYQSGGVRACGRPVTNSGSCASVQFPSNGISYSQVCGRVVGYQFNSPDAVGAMHGRNHDFYADGVSITHGSPREHVWTLMAGFSQLFYQHSNCPCDGTSKIPSFIGDHFFCESGNPTTEAVPVFYTSDPLWDGKGCGSLQTDCCNAPGLPWFHRDYGTNTYTDYLELRVCCDQNSNNEDVPVSYYEIYVK